MTSVIGDVFVFVFVIGDVFVLLEIVLEIVLDIVVRIVRIVVARGGGSRVAVFPPPTRGGFFVSSFLVFSFRLRFPGAKRAHFRGELRDRGFESFDFSLRGGVCSETAKETAFGAYLVPHERRLAELSQGRGALARKHVSERRAADSAARPAEQRGRPERRQQTRGDRGVAAQVLHPETQRGVHVWVEPRVRRARQRVRGRMRIRRRVRADAPEWARESPIRAEGPGGEHRGRPRGAGRLGALRERVSGQRRVPAQRRGRRRAIRGALRSAGGDGPRPLGASRSRRGRRLRAGAHPGGVPRRARAGRAYPDGVPCVLKERLDGLRVVRPRGRAPSGRRHSRGVRSRARLSTLPSARALREEPDAIKINGYAQLCVLDAAPRSQAARSGARLVCTGGIVEHSALARDEPRRGVACTRHRAVWAEASRAGAAGARVRSAAVRRWGTGTRAGTPGARGRGPPPFVVIF